jgi:hypothetical protein
MKQSETFKSAAIVFFWLTVGCALILAGSFGWRVFLFTLGIISLTLSFASYECHKDAKKEENLS